MARDLLGRRDLVSERQRTSKIWQLGSLLGYERDFLLGEVEYVLGRFPPERIGDLTNPRVRHTYERRGRGTVPRVERPQRERFDSGAAARVEPVRELAGERAETALEARGSPGRVARTEHPERERDLFGRVAAEDPGDSRGEVAVCGRADHGFEWP
jgi:hypothetical protein